MNPRAVRSSKVRMPAAYAGSKNPPGANSATIVSAESFDGVIPSITVSEVTTTPPNP
jgi:hypothetical protein